MGSKQTLYLYELLPTGPHNNVIEIKYLDILWQFLVFCIVDVVTTKLDVKTNRHHLLRNFYKLYIMPTRSCLLCKTTKDPCFPWPKDFCLKKAWTEWVRSNYSEIIIKEQSFFCYKHFETSCFSNYHSWVQTKDKGKPTT